MIKKTIKTAGLVYLISSSITFSILYLMAFFGDNTASMHIDLLGEKIWESPLIFFGMICSLFTSIILLKKEKSEVHHASDV